MNPNRSVLEGEIYERAYSLDNIEIFDDPTVTKGLCAIFFSSAGLYYPNTENELEKSVLIANRYEWKKVRLPFVKRYIYIRDVSKTFYLLGINRQISSIDDTLNKINEITNGYKVICIGSSAGAYFATLIGSMLESCVYVLEFSGYYNLNILDEEKWPVINEFRNNEALNRWYDTKPIIEKRKCEIFRFYPTDLEEDRNQTKHIQNCGVKIFPIKSRKHGIPFYKTELYYLLTLDEKSLMRIYKEMDMLKTISQVKFAWALARFKGLKLLLSGFINERLIPKIYSKRH